MQEPEKKLKLKPGREMKWKKCSILLRVMVDLKHIPETLGVRREYKQDGMPVRRRALRTHKYTLVHT